ncbi:LiaF transmembrane domain-containing protein [Anaerocolumna sp. MB42-C2]|uniref:LiaF transmembrane domain-containing protein n=1 Tax=Anaerocolumna sp. MB42-C2 TaxID=3070997 RepID=UPI0027DF9343|nr:LiaF domain-containing protein [Anaerocolumna sp. MB42-C2]WMJ90038.1 LiaF-related protein [Anaerocolumna sp. MB42-C2]
MRIKTSNMLWGLFFILIGVGFAGNAFNLWNFELFFRGWWTLFIIIPCAISLIQNGFRVSNLAGLIIGIMLLMSSQGIVDGNVMGKLIVPFIFVLIGLSMIFKNLYHGDRNFRIDVKYQGGAMEHSAIFSGNRYQVTGEKFLGTTINAIFGGVDLDLRNAIIDEDIVINATAVFGGIDILVPANVKVKVSNVPIFGGVDNKAGTSQDPNAPTIFLNSTCMFGGIDVK